MTAEEKTILARFLDLSGDYARYGHTMRREEYIFEDDEAIEQASLPLAYMIEEPSDSIDSLESVESEDLEKSSDSLEAIAADVAACAACPLSRTRTLAVSGEGSVHPQVMVIGEGPGAEGDRTGRPFVGQAGQLLDRMLLSIGLDRNKNCYIANMVKCRPPGNRDPEANEIAACSPFLKRQIALLKPAFILCAGRIAAQSFLKTGKGISALRGEFHEFRPDPEAGSGKTDIAIPVLCTFHPSALLRDESLKRPAWEDLKLLKSRLDYPVKD